MVSVNVIARVVTFDGQPAVLASRCADGDRVIILKRVEEAIGVVGGEGLDTGVVYSEDEGGGQGCVGPKTRGVRHRGLSVGLEVADKTFVGNDAGFF